MAPDDTTLINRHLEVLHEELLELGHAVDRAEALRREAVLDELETTFGDTLAGLAALEVGLDDVDAEQIVACTLDAFAKLGLERFGPVGEIHELWPEEAEQHFTLDRALPKKAAMVRVEIIARGWRRNSKVITPPRGRILEVIENEE